MNNANRDARVTQLSVGYSAVEDRLLISASREDHNLARLLVTRRIAQTLVDGLARVLEISNANAASASQEIRSEIVLLEHQIATESLIPAANPSGSVDVATGRLVTRLNVKILPTDFEIVIFDQEDVALTMLLGRFELHRLVEFLRQSTDKIGWNLQFGTPWLNESAVQSTIN